jgi:hypothetical protein
MGPKRRLQALPRKDLSSLSLPVPKLHLHPGGWKWPATPSSPALCSTTSDFLDPHSPWHRGWCKNTNGRLRQVLSPGSKYPLGVPGGEAPLAPSRLALCARGETTGLRAAGARFCNRCRLPDADRCSSHPPAHLSLPAVQQNRTPLSGVGSRVRTRCYLSGSQTLRNRKCPQPTPWNQTTPKPAHAWALWRSPRRTVRDSLRQPGQKRRIGPRSRLQ